MYAAGTYVSAITWMGNKYLFTYVTQYFESNNNFVSLFIFKLQ